MMIDEFQSWYSCVEKPITWFGYRLRRKSIWLSSSSLFSDGYTETQWLIASGMFLDSKNVTRSSMSFSGEPPVDTIAGFLVLAMVSISGQSLMSELAILIIGRPSSTQRATDASSKGVAMGMHPP